MNGRVQNPLWGRMLSPDPVLADLELPQGLNPYSYVGNNPASRVDPTGLTGIHPIRAAENPRQPGAAHRGLWCCPDPSGEGSDLPLPLARIRRHPELRVGHSPSQ